MNSTHFDLVIIGSGSGNSLVTPDFDNWKIAIIEEGTFGGTCLNVGCIPTKMFVYPAETAHAAREQSRLGIHGAPPVADWAEIRDRVFGRIDAISAGGRDYREGSGSPNVTLFEAHAEFSGARELKLSTGESITADNIVVAAGSRVFVPPMLESSGVPFHTSDTVMRIDSVPERTIILGGGYIASEFAGIFSGFGSHVTVVSRSPLLADHDREMIDRFTDIVRDQWHLHTGHLPTGFRQDAGGIHVDLDDGSTITGDLLLVAVGRIPNGDRLNLAAAGVDVHPDGRIVVDEYQRTTAEGVWALGDVSTKHQLKHVANHEERTVAHNLAHPDDLRASDHRFVPSAVFTHPQLATVGLTEEQAVGTDRPFVCKTQEYGGTAYGWAMADETSMCKLLADPTTGMLLGAHIMGEQASTLIQPIIQAMSFGLGVREMARGQYWIHPALTEVVENALLGLELD